MACSSLTKAKKKVLIGTRLAATKERKSKHDEKDTQEEDYEKIAAGLNMETMNEARETASSKPSP